MAPYYFPPPTFFSSGTGFGASSSPSSTTPTTPPHMGFRERMGWKDPRVRSQLVQAILSSPNLNASVGALLGSQGIADQYREYDRQKKLEEEDRVRREEDRQRRIRLEDEDRARRAEQDRRQKAEVDYQKRQRDFETARSFGERRTYREDVEAAVKGGKIDEGLARILRREGADKGTEQLRALLYPSENEKLAREATRAGIASTRALTEKREQPVRPTDPRLLLNSQIDATESSIRAMDARFNALSYYEKEKARPEYDAARAAEVARRESYRTSLDTLGSERVLEERLTGGGGAGGAGAGGNTNVMEGIIRAGSLSAGLSPEQANQTIQAARERGILERMAELMGPPLNLNPQQAQMRAERELMAGGAR